ncbi:MAG: tetratricopeptide repeat protein [Pseudonocardiaceae bacterium]
MHEPNLTPEVPTNAALESYLTRLGWSPEQLASHLNELARRMRLPEEIHPKTPRRWLRARPPNVLPCVPRQPWPALVCTLLSRQLHEPVTLACLGWQTSAGALYVPADDGLDHAWDPRGAVASLREVLEAPGMDRRHFVTISGTTLTAFAHNWLLDPARIAASIQGKRVDHAVVDDLERVADARRRLDDALGGGIVFRVVREDLRLVTKTLDNASYTEQVGQRLYAVAAEFARLAGLLAYDNNHQALAQRYFLTGLRAAHSSGNRAVGANILGFMSKQARDRDPRDAVRLAESALVGAKDLTPAVESWIQARLASSAAAAGDAIAADRAQGRMFELTATVDPAVEPAWIYWWSEAEAHYHAGQSALALNNSQQAETHFRNALARLSPSFPRDRINVLTRLALVRVRLGELDGACRAASEAAGLLRRLDSEHKRTRLAEFRKTVQPYAATAQVKDFDAKFGDLIRSTSV